MIRRSVLVAVAAFVLSLLVHMLGLSLGSGEAPAPALAENAIDVADVGSAFEDLSEALPEPEPPEPAQAPEPPDVVTPEPAAEEVPTSQALVASDNPQDVTMPDSGTAEVIEPDAAGPPENDAAPSQSEEAPDAAAESQAAAPQEALESTAEPLEAEPPAPEASPPVAPDTPAPDIVIAALPDAPEILSPDGAETGASTAVARSLRPPKDRPSAEALGVPDRPRQPRASPGRVVSPLAAYKNSGVDLLSGAGGGGSAFSGARGPGNATATNYAGQILMRLNRAPVVYASARGVARVSFQINADGSLGWIRILNSSGSRDIEEAARAQVRSAAPFPRPPSGTSKTLVFNYRNR